jgi:hypothetical protein
MANVVMKHSISSELARGAEAMPRSSPREIDL